MSDRRGRNRIRLLALAGRIAARPEPLGIGLHNQCWGGVAAGVAKGHGYRTTSYYGLTFREFKNAIKDNNAAPAGRRNRRMALRTLLLALT